MDYNLHITRKEDWCESEGPEIGLREWVSYVLDDKSMRMEEKPVAALEHGIAPGTKNESLAVWKDWAGNRPDGPRAWMWHVHGNVMARNPDAAMRRKMFLIAVALDARLQGDEGEDYNSMGEPVKRRREAGVGRRKKPWWKLW